VDINSITFRRKVNTGNFESFDVEATATSVVAEDAKAAARALQAYVDQLCNERVEALRHPGARGGKDAPEFPEL
jgi:hypothetical protein